MSKKFVAIIAGLVVAAGFGAGVDAGESINRMVTPPTQTIEPSKSFSVTYGACTFWEAVVFEFEGVTQTINCNALGPDVQTLRADRPQGLRAGPLPGTLGTATATFTGPGTPGTYGGIAYATERQDLEPVNLQGLRGPVAAAATLTSSRVAAVLDCTEQRDCVEFQVIVEQPTTTASTTTTTLAPTTTVAPTTTEAAVTPPAPTTTVAITPSLPATGPSQNDNAMAIAIALLVAGGGLILATRWRASHS